MMAENQFSSVMDSLLRGMNTVLSARTVLGEPTVVGDTTIITLVDVTFGIGAGASDAGAVDARGGKNEEKKRKGSGAIGGKMTPSAVLIIRNGSVKLVNIKNQDAVTKMLDLVPDVLDKFAAGKKGEETISDEEAVDIAFPEKTETDFAETVTDSERIEASDE